MMRRRPKSSLHIRRRDLLEVAHYFYQDDHSADINFFLHDGVVELDETRELVEAGQVLHSKVFNLAPLQELCMRTIVLNLPKFSAAPQLLDCLSPTVKSDILLSVFDMMVTSPDTHSSDIVRYLAPAAKEDSSSLQLMKRINGGWSPEWPMVSIELNVLKQLINCSFLPSFDFTICRCKFFFQSHGSDMQILQLLAENPEGMRSIVDRRRKTPHEEQRAIAGRRVIQYLEKFTNLEHLHMPTIIFNDEDVERLSKSCRKLKSMTLVYRDTLTIRGIESLSTLPHLEQLSLGRRSRNRTSIYQHALQMMPHLKEITHFGAEPADFNGNIRLDIRGQTYSLERLNTPLDHCTDIIPTCLPNVKEVFIGKPSGLRWNDALDEFIPRPHVLSPLPLVTALTIIGTFAGFFDYFTEPGLLSPRLTHVTLVDCFARGMELLRLFLFCPNLVSLKVDGKFTLNTEIDLDPQLLKLEELHLGCSASEEDEFNQQFSLCKLLLAPKLHTLYLRNVFIPVEAIIAISDGVEAILQNLVNFESSHVVGRVGDYAKYVRFLNLVVQNCPKLKTVKCSVHNSDENLTIKLLDVSPKLCCPFSVKRV